MWYMTYTIFGVHCIRLKAFIPCQTLLLSVSSSTICDTQPAHTNTSWFQVQKYNLYVGKKKVKSSSTLLSIKTHLPYCKRQHYHAINLFFSNHTSWSALIRFYFGFGFPFFLCATLLLILFVMSIYLDICCKAQMKNGAGTFFVNKMSSFVAVFI